MEYFISIYAGEFSKDLYKTVKNGRNLIQTTLNHIIYHEKSRGKFASGFSIFIKVKLTDIHFQKHNQLLKKIKDSVHIPQPEFEIKEFDTDNHWS